MFQSRKLPVQSQWEPSKSVECSADFAYQIQFHPLTPFNKLFLMFPLCARLQK